MQAVGKHFGCDQPVGPRPPKLICHTLDGVGAGNTEHDVKATIVCCSILQYAIIYYSILQYTMVEYSIIYV